MNSFSEKNNYLIKNTKIFAISNLATKLISFLLIPLYTYCLNTSEYGTIDLLFTIVSVILPLFTFNIAESIYRFSLDKDCDRKDVYNIGFACIKFCLVSSIIIFPVLHFFPKYYEYRYYIYLLLNSSAIFTISSANLKGNEKLKEYAVGNILNTIFIITLNIIFLKFMGMKIQGYFLAFILSYILSSLYCILVNIEKYSFKKIKLNVKLLKAMLKYSVVLIPNSFLWWIIDSSDRVMITYYDGIEINGLYAISYKIPAIIFAVAGIFNQAWVFSAIREKDDKDNVTHANEIFNFFASFMIFIAFIILLFLKPIFKLLLSSNYYDAWLFVPILLCGSIFLTLSNFLSASYNTYKDSKGLLLSSLFAAIFNFALNFLLIPYFNAYGAAIATCISYFLVFLYRIKDTQKYLKIRFQYNNYLSLFLLIMSIIAIYFGNIVAYVTILGAFIIFIILNINFFKDIMKFILIFLKRGNVR